MISVCSDDYNVIILNVGVYCYVVGGWSESSLMFMMLQ